MIHLAMTGLMARRLTDENALSGLDPTPQTSRTPRRLRTGR
jgi:hypothetical protein